MSVFYGFLRVFYTATKYRCKTYQVGCYTCSSTMGPPFWRTRSSAIAERPRDASC